MKWLILSLLFSVSAQASYYATHCSTAHAKVHWETGHNSNTMTLEGYSEAGLDIIIPFHDLKVAFDKEVVIKDERIHRCGYASSTKVTAAIATITPSSEKPDALDFLGNEKKLTLEVICETHFNSRAGCPE